MRIAITGGTGSFGQALTTKLLGEGLAERIVILSRDEVKQGDMAEKYAHHPALRFFLGDVRDHQRLVDAFHGCKVVVHAAALKRVDKVARDPDETTKTNILGTMNVVRAAIDADVHRVIVISSDKAVAPANAYGASKLMAEFYSVAANSYGHPRGTVIACVRYGNVWSSRGSVIHIWRQQMARGEPITLTDARMTRFFLTLNEAAEIVLQALHRMIGGEIFVPLLPSFRIADLAAAVAPGHDVKIVGLRPGGEKLAEQLLSEEEVSRTLWDSDLYVVQPSHHPWSDDPYRGLPIPPSFIYRSDKNSRWLSIEDLREIVE